MGSRIDYLKGIRSKEWNKPKAVNITSVHDKREVRNYKVIVDCHTKINKLKNGEE